MNTAVRTWLEPAGRIVPGGGVSHPDEMQVIWHEHIGGAEEPLTNGRMEEEFAEPRVEQVVQPADGAALRGEGPVNDSVGPVA